MRMASAKRELLEPEEPEPQFEAKRTKLDTPDSSSKSDLSKQRVVLNPADCDLDFDIEGNGLEGHALHEQGFAYCWSGARANVGINGGKYCFGCKIIAAQPVTMEDTPLDQQHVCRLGISSGDDPIAHLGETVKSFGFGGTGKFSFARNFLDYGEKFGVGDTIVCAVDLQGKPLASIGFSKNRKWLGVAKQFDAGPKGLGVVDSATKERPWESAFFPHILLKNVVVQVQFSIEDGLVPEEGYKPWASALEDGNAIMGPTFPDFRDCEVMMMVGLPASGKSTWSEKRVKENPNKRYVLLGTNLALDQMKVPGLLRKHNYGERFDLLMDRATGIFNTLLSRASKTPRNYIVDQTNVYKSARKRKLKPFANFQKIAVVIFPTPDQLRFRSEKRVKEMGKEVPADAINEMLANFVLPKSKDMPGSDEFFDEVVFPELNRVEAQRCLAEMKQSIGPASNLPTKKDQSPYFRESSIQSCGSLPLQNYNTLSATGSGQVSHSPLPPLKYDYRWPQPVNSASPGGRPYGIPDSYSEAYHGGYSSPLPRSVSDGNLGYGYSSLPRNDLGPYGSGGDYNTPLSREAESRSTVSGLNDPYGSSLIGGAHNRTSMERSHFVPSGATGINPYWSSMMRPYGGHNYETQSSYGSPIQGARTPIQYNAQHGSFGDCGHPQAVQRAPGGPPHLHNDIPPSYGSPAPPYGTPMPRPPYANHQPHLQHPGGHAPPPPRYY
ncbi:hypothetical protein RJ641_002109 [Dillenia turbinata]|uniref:SPRY domain-containing protein n=1 Tax=Dillenia turbinata TaxID=194707 RepID=A0AAN8VDX0_9MAGN